MNDNEQLMSPAQAAYEAWNWYLREGTTPFEKLRAVDQQMWGRVAGAVIDAHEAGLRQVRETRGKKKARHRMAGLRENG